MLYRRNTYLHFFIFIHAFAEVAEEVLKEPFVAAPPPLGPRAVPPNGYYNTVLESRD